MQSLRILMVVPRYRPAIGGLEKHVEKVCEGLLRKGHKITILTSSHLKELLAEERINDISIIRIPFGIDRNPILSYLWILRNRRKFVEFDLVHVHDPLPFLFWYLPLRVLRKQMPVYATFHGFERDPVPVIFRIIRKIVRKLVRRVLCIGRFIDNIYDVRCDAVSIGAVESFQPSSGNRTGLIFVGRLEEDTGILEYLQALVLLRAEHRISLPLTICGTGTLSNSLKALVQENNLDVQFRGLVDEPISIMNTSRIALAAGYLSILEAMAAGLPVIAIAKSPLKYDYYRQVIVEGGPISIQTTSEGVASEIIRLEKNKELSKSVTNRGIAFAKRMTWERVVSHYLKLWQDNE